MSRDDIKSKTEPLIEMLSIKLDTILEEYDKIREEGTMYSIPVLLSPKVETLVNELNEQREESVDGDPADYNNLVRQSDGEHVLKLATLHAIDEQNFKERCGLIVEEKHWNQAKEFFDRATEGNKEVYDRIGIKKISAESHTEPIERVYRIIATKSIVTRSELYSTLRLTTKVLDEFLASLLTAERIEIRQIKNKQNKFVTYYGVKGAFEKGGTAEAILGVSLTS
jgi:hypothetical protein